MQSFRNVVLIAAFGFAGLAQAQAPVAPATAAAPLATTIGGIKSQSIFQVRPDANELPGYANQTNAERSKVQPGNNAPIWRQEGGGLTGLSSLPVSQAPEAGNLIQRFVQYPGSRLTNAGDAWREVRNQWLIPYGSALLGITVLALAIYFFSQGTILTHGKDTGRKIERFTPFERAAHWSNAIAFVALAVSGIFMAFGKFFLLPILGGAVFGWVTWLLKTMHNFAGPVFAVSLVIVFVTFVRDNIPEKADLNWLLKGGGLFGGEEPASQRFNAGEKIVFWSGVTLLGLVVISSGFVLDKILPFLIYERATMQIAHMVHLVATVLMMCMFTAHIYLGTIGMQGAYKGMRTGYVDETWAKEHHATWFDDVKAGRIPVQRSKLPSEKTAAAALKSSPQA